MKWFWNKRLGKQTYRMHIPLFILLCLLVLGTLGYVLFLTGFSDQDMYFVSCPNITFNGSVSGLCRNPLFNSSACLGKLEGNSSFCSVEFLSPGQSLGSRPSFFFRNFSLIVAFYFFLVLGLNHFLFNRKFVIEVDNDEGKDF